MDNFLDTNYLSALNQEDTNSKLIITTNYIKTLAKSPSNKEKPRTRLVHCQILSNL